MHTPPRRIVAPEDRAAFGRQHREAAHLSAQLRGATSLREAVLALQAARSELPGHLREEEARDGLFDWLAALAPWRGPDIEELRRQHVELLIDLDEAWDDLADVDEARTESVLAGLRELADRIDAHEVLEMSVLADATGAGGPRA